MDTFFLFQLVFSFVVAGGSMTLLSLLAEKTNGQIAGIIITFPVTLAFGFLFLGWTLSPESVVAVIPTTLIPLGFSLLFLPIYISVAQFSEKISMGKIYQIATSFSVSLVCWMFCAISAALFGDIPLSIGIAGYMFLIFLAHMWLQSWGYGQKKREVIYTPVQKSIRFCFVGFIVMIVILCGKFLNPFFGGILAMFPAGFSAVLMILHWYYSPKELPRIFQKAPLGSLSLFAYTMVVMGTFSQHGIFVGTLLAYFSSFMVTLMLQKI